MCSSSVPLADRYPTRAAHWRLRTRTLALSRRPLLMGIVNATPDSFSDGGKYFDPQAAVEHALQLVEEGADLLDVGGESTRPYADPVSADEELRRVIPIVEQLFKLSKAPLSIDTSKAAVAEAACAAGAEIINDVTALQGDPRMLGVALAASAGVCAMHMLGTPQTMQDNPRYDDVTGEVMAFLARRKEALLAAGIDRERICLDPGIGFGKTTQHNLTLMAHCGRLHELGCPVLIGHSRKGFLTKIFGSHVADGDIATAGGALAAAVQGVQIIRVHNVRVVREALLPFEACGGIDGQELRLEGPSAPQDPASGP